MLEDHRPDKVGKYDYLFDSESVFTSTQILNSENRDGKSNVIVKPLNIVGDITDAMVLFLSPCLHLMEEEGSREVRSSEFLRVSVFYHPLLSGNVTCLLFDSGSLHVTGRVPERRSVIVSTPILGPGRKSEKGDRSRGPWVSVWERFPSRIRSTGIWSLRSSGERDDLSSLSSSGVPSGNGTLRDLYGTPRVQIKTQRLRF